jgi:hypothetical protein
VVDTDPVADVPLEKFRVTESPEMTPVNESVFVSNFSPDESK